MKSSFFRRAHLLLFFLLGSLTVTFNAHSQGTVKTTEIIRTSPENSIQLKKELDEIAKNRSDISDDAETAARKKRIEKFLNVPKVPDNSVQTDKINHTLGAVIDGVTSEPPQANSLAQSPKIEAPEQRLALVIGNSAYKTSPLANPANDARAMAIKLQQLGFAVIKKENAGREEMMEAVREFGTRLKNGGVGLFYYAGHGIQSKGINYLVPVDSNIVSEDELSTRAYNATEILEKMETARNRLNMVILDACRDNPFARSFRSGARGLAGGDQAPSRTLIAYATSPGSTAADGNGVNGLYTEQLLQAMSEPGMKVEDVFKRVRTNVQERSAGKQLPWEMSSVTGDFFFNPTSEQVAMGLNIAPAVSGKGAQMPSTPRHLIPILIPRKLIENYQLAGSLSVNAAPTFGAFSADSKRFTLASKDKTLTVWDGYNGLPISAEVGVAQLSLFQRYLLSVSGNGHVSIVDLQSENADKLFTNLPSGIVTAGISPNNKRLLIYTRNNGFLLYSMETQQRIGQFDNVVDGQPQFEFSANGDRLVTWGSAASNLTLWDVERGTKINRLTSHWKPVSFTKFSTEGALLMTSAIDDKVIIWRSSDGDDIKKFKFSENNSPPLKSDFFNNGKRLLAHVNTGPNSASLILGVWDTATGTLLASLLPGDVTLNSYHVSPDQSKLFVSSSDRNVHVFDLNTLKRVTTMVGVQFIDFSPNGKRFLLMGNEGIRLMDSQSMASISRMPSQLTAFFAPKKVAIFATASADGILTLWNLDNGDPIGQLKGHIDAVTHVVFSDDGARLVSIGTDNTGKLWSMPEIKDSQQLVKDVFESTAEYTKRMSQWSSPYTSLVNLVGFNADTEIYTVKFGDISVGVPIERDAAKKLVSQRQATISGTIKFFDVEQLILDETKLTRLP